MKFWFTSSLCLRLIAGLTGLPRCIAAQSNVTVDDNDPSVVYFPADDWSFGPTCSTCTVHPDPTQVYNGTWHDTLYGSQDQAQNIFQTVEFSFNGTAIYVYGILSNALNSPSGNADQLFFIDDQASQTFTHTPSGDGSFVYNSILYANTNLANGHHTLKMQNGKPGDLSSLILLDRFIYTSGDDESSTSAAGGTPSSPATSPSVTTFSSARSSSTPSTAPGASASKEPSHRRTILLALLIPSFILLAIMSLVVWHCRRKNMHNRTLSHYPVPFIEPNTGAGAASNQQSHSEKTVGLLSGGSPGLVPRESGTTTVLPLALSRSEGNEAANPATHSSSTQPSYPTLPPTQSAPVMFAPISLSHLTPGPHDHGATSNVRRTHTVVLASFPPNSLSNQTGYPVLASWPQSEESSAPPAYEHGAWASDGRERFL